MTKLTFIGACSYTFGPSLIWQAVSATPLRGMELCLVDLNEDLLEPTAAAARRLSESKKADVRITSTTSMDEGLEGASYAVCSIAPGMMPANAKDRAIIEEHLPDHLITEFGGIAGLSNSLRQIHMILGLTDRMKRLCPDARLLDVANPLPRVCQAAEENGVPTIGFCYAAGSVYSWVWQILHGEAEPWPWTRARERYELISIGVNHFTWLVSAADRQSGEDILPLLRERIQEGATTGNPISERHFLETGYWLLPNDQHTADFLPPRDETPSHAELWHGDPQQRQERAKTLRKLADGSLPIEHFEKLNMAWEEPASVVAALEGIHPAFLPALNLPNHGQIPNLPENLFVETPAEIDANSVRPTPQPLPEPVLDLTRQVAEQNDRIVRAAREKSWDLLREACHADPTILDKEKGWLALQACVKAHRNLNGWQDATG